MQLYLRRSRLPPCHIVHDQTYRWLAAGVFETIVHDLRALLRVLSGRDIRPSAGILDSRTLQSTPESGDRTGHTAQRQHGAPLRAA